LGDIIWKSHRGHGSILGGKVSAKKLITENQKITDCHEIFDGRATIRRNQRSGGVWQFHMWLRAENKQYRKSLRTSHFETAVERAEEMYMAVVSAQKAGRKIFSPTVKNSIEMYLEKRSEECATDILDRLFGV